ncbi:hypothetical protein ACHAW5_008127 [Stephanodiscus triporus]|uniref:HECT-type E3 ubiquitin transferase n=1 Tax=Stephanodiscus triporus TaxID=2934178 RepID=A0ABD3NKN6_9STRA
MLDPFSDDVVPSPYPAPEDSSSSSGGVWSPWQQQQPQIGAYRGDFFYPPGPPHQQHHFAAPTIAPQSLRDARDWEDELVSSLWRSGRPELLRCVSTLIMSVVCALDARHVLVDRKTHRPNDFGIGNALLPPGGGGTSTAGSLLPVHRRLDPEDPAVEEGWVRRDVFGLLLVPYALLLRDHRDAAGTTYSQCLTVASQLKSLTFARLTLLPSLSTSLTERAGGCRPSSSSSSSSIYDFYLSVLSEFTAQYVDALGATGNLPITRREWFDEETNTAQSEWMEREQRRQFGEWAGQLPEDQVEEDDALGGPKAVNVMDRPDCLEDVFALVSSVCEAYPSGARAFWNVVEEPRRDGEEGDASLTAILAPSRALQTLDHRQSDNDSSLCVYLTFLASLALADGVGGGPAGGTGAALVHSYLSGNRAINPHGTTDRRMHFLWNTIVSSIRWYAENLSPNDDEGAAAASIGGKGKEGTNKSSKIRLSSNSAMDESSSYYYYGVSGGGVAAGGSSTNAEGDASSPLSERSNRGSPSTSSVSAKMELDELGRNTLMALLCLVANVASKCHAARAFVLGIQLPVSDSNDGGEGLGLQDGSLEILFSLLTITSLPPEIMGMTFVAIANLLQPNEDCSGATSAAVILNLSESVAPAAIQNDVSIVGARRAWELMEMCQFVPIKLLSQYSSYAAGAGSMPRSASSNFTTQKMMQSSFGANDLPSSTFPKSTDYGMIYQFEHVETKLGQYHATEGFLFLLSTLVKVVGCPSTLGSQWRLRPGCAPYIEYVTDFVLPRAVGMDKNVQPTFFASVSAECRLIERALEVIEAVIVRYVVPPPSTSVFNMDDVKDRYLANVKSATQDMGWALIASDIFFGPVNLEEEGIDNGVQDFRNAYLLPQDAAALWKNARGSNEMLEASFGNQVPLPKTTGFAIMCNLLSTNGGVLFQIIQKLLSEKGGAKGIREYGESMHSRLLAKSLFRETPPNLACARDFAIIKAQKEQNIISEKARDEKISSLQQTLIQSLNPLLLLSYYEKSCIATDDIGANKSHGAMSNDAVLWRERTHLLSLRILCAAAAREEAFIESLNEAGPLGVVPTLCFQGPIHGSFAHRFVHEEKVNVSRLSQLLTKGSSAGHHGRHNSLEILPIIAEFVGYDACSLSNPQIIARCAFSIVSYIARTLPHAECVQSLRRNHDVDGIQLANAFSRGLSSHSSIDISSMEPISIQDAILDLILSNIYIANSASDNLNISIMVLGLSGESKHNCLNVVLDLIADSDIVLDPQTSFTATKCFALIHRVCELCTIQGLSANVRRQQALFMEKLRRMKFWQTQVVRYLGMRGPSTRSIFHEISNRFSLEYGHDMEISRRDNDFLHCISFLLKGLAVELRLLTGQKNQSSSNISGGMMPSSSKLNVELQSLLNCLLAQPNSSLLTMLIDMPLGQSSNGFIRERLHMIEAPPSEALKNSSMTLTDPVDACAGYEIIDIERLVCHFKSRSQSNSLEKSKEWATAWNSFVGRVCACSHLAQAWSDVVRVALICSPLVHDIVEPQTNHFMNTRAIMDILCTILSRLLNPSHLDALSQCCSFHPAENVFAANIEAECAMPLSIAALGLIEVLVEATSQIETGSAVAGLIIAEEDVARVCALVIGAISSCSECSTGMYPNDGRAAVLSCALTRILLYSEDAAYCVFSQNSPSILSMNANAVALLFRLSTASVFDSDEKYADAQQANNGAIANAARSGLLSLFGHLKSFEELEVVSEMCSKIFASEEVSYAAAKLVHMITKDDNDVSFLLQQIALFRDGVELLAKAGVTVKLLEFAKMYSQSECSFLASHLGTDGAARLKPPLLLKGHLSLLNGLLASPLQSSDRVALAIDSYQLVKTYSGLFERLTQQYPTDIDLTIKFVHALQLTYTALEEATGMTLGRKLLDLDEPLLILERSVLRITCRLSAFPFPSHLLPPLPMGLINVEAMYASQMKNISINTGSESSWWDNIPDIATKGGQPLPVPPTGSFDVSTQQKFSSYQYGTESAWSERNYEFAISSARCLESSISILISRVNFVSQRDLSTFSIDAVAIAKGVCRCSDASRAIQDRLVRLKSHPEEDITKMLDASHVMNDWRVERPPLSRALMLERDYLVRLGISLGRCAEKLVCLALLDALRMAARSPYASKPEYTHQWAYFIGALTPALDHTEMETKGIGCASGYDVEASMTMARGLRREMEKMRINMAP